MNILETQILNSIKNISINNFDEIIGQNKLFLTALNMAQKVAPSSAPIFICGESGTGKEVFAQYIHRKSNVATGPFVVINCSAIPEALLESELFGHAKGSFTGAFSDKMGLFEVAQNGTLFLDEIGDLSLIMQAKILRVIQEKKIKRVGENKERLINCRIISATHKNLLEEVNEFRFREDLYFRLNVIAIEIPSLRERLDDLLLLAENFLKYFSLKNKSNATIFSDEAIDYIQNNNWRGNIRELKNSIERAVILSTGCKISLADITPLLSINLSKKISSEFIAQNCNQFYIDIPKELPSLENVIKKYIEYAINRNHGARDKTAQLIGIDRKTLYKKIKAP